MKPIKKIWQEYFKQRVIGISLGGNSGEIYEQCPVCENSESLSKSFMFRNKNIEDVYRELDYGKYLTIDCYQKLNKEQRGIYLRRLDCIGAYAMMEFLQKNA